MPKRQKAWYDTQNWLPPDDDELAGSGDSSLMGVIDLGRDGPPGERVHRVIAKVTHSASCRWTALCA